MPKRRVQIAFVGMGGAQGPLAGMPPGAQVAPAAALRAGPQKARKARKWADPPGWAYGPDNNPNKAMAGASPPGLQFGIGMGGQLRKFIKARLGGGLFRIGAGRPDGRIN